MVGFCTTSDFLSWQCIARSHPNIHSPALEEDMLWWHRCGCGTSGRRAACAPSTSTTRLQPSCSASPGSLLLYSVKIPLQPCLAPYTKQGRTDIAARLPGSAKESAQARLTGAAHVAASKPCMALQVPSQCGRQQHAYTSVRVGGSSAGAHLCAAALGRKAQTLILHTCARQAPAAQALRPGARAAGCACHGARRLCHGGAADAGRPQLAHGWERLARAPLGCAALQAGPSATVPKPIVGLHDHVARCRWR